MVNSYKRSNNSAFEALKTPVKDFTIGINTVDNCDDRDDEQNGVDISRNSASVLLSSSYKKRGSQIIVPKTRKVDRVKIKTRALKKEDKSNIPKVVTTRKDTTGKEEVNISRDEESILLSSTFKKKGTQVIAPKTRKVERVKTIKKRALKKGDKAVLPKAATTGLNFNSVTDTSSERHGDAGVLKPPSSPDYAASYASAISPRSTTKTGSSQPRPLSPEECLNDLLDFENHKTRSPVINPKGNVDIFDFNEKLTDLKIKRKEEMKGGQSSNEEKKVNDMFSQASIQSSEKGISLEQCSKEDKTISSNDEGKIPGIGFVLGDDDFFFAERDITGVAKNLVTWITNNNEDDLSLKRSSNEEKKVNKVPLTGGNDGSEPSSEFKNSEVGTELQYKTPNKSTKNQTTVVLPSYEQTYCEVLTTSPTSKPRTNERSVAKKLHKINGKAPGLRLNASAPTRMNRKSTNQVTKSFDVDTTSNFPTTDMFDAFQTNDFWAKESAFIPTQTNRSRHTGSESSSSLTSNYHAEDFEPKEFPCESKKIESNAFSCTFPFDDFVPKESPIAIIKPEETVESISSNEVDNIVLKEPTERNNACHLNDCVAKRPKCPPAKIINREAKILDELVANTHHVPPVKTKILVETESCFEAHKQVVKKDCTQNERGGYNGSLDETISKYYSDFEDYVADIATVAVTNVVTNDDSKNWSKGIFALDPVIAQRMDAPTPNMHNRSKPVIGDAAISSRQQNVPLDVNNSNSKSPSSLVSSVVTSGIENMKDVSIFGESPSRLVDAVVSSGVESPIICVTDSESQVMNTPRTEFSLADTLANSEVESPRATPLNFSVADSESQAMSIQRTKKSLVDSFATSEVVSQPSALSSYEKSAEVLSANKSKFLSHNPVLLTETIDMIQSIENLVTGNINRSDNRSQASNCTPDEGADDSKFRNLMKSMINEIMLGGHTSPEIKLDKKNATKDLDHVISPNDVSCFHLDDTNDNESPTDVASFPSNHDDLEEMPKPEEDLNEKKVHDTSIYNGMIYDDHKGEFEKKSVELGQAWEEKNPIPFAKIDSTCKKIDFSSVKGRRKSKKDVVEKNVGTNMQKEKKNDENEVALVKKGLMIEPAIEEKKKNRYSKAETTCKKLEFSPMKGLPSISERIAALRMKPKGVNK